MLGAHYFLSLALADPQARTYSGAPSECSGLTCRVPNECWGWLLPPAPAGHPDLRSLATGCGPDRRPTPPWWQRALLQPSPSPPPATFHPALRMFLIPPYISTAQAVLMARASLHLRYTNRAAISDKHCVSGFCILNR